mgnify:CR=1 FL=1
MSLTVTSEDLVDKGNQIIQLYNQYLGRDPLQGGLDGWLATGQSIEQIEQGIANSPEAGVFQTFNETVGRDPTMEERDYFVNVNPTPIEAVEEVLSSTQEAQQFQTQQQLDETDLLELHGQGYQTTIDAGVEFIMASFNSWNGQKGLAVKEMKQMVKELHKNGIAVILDVVINHVSNYDYHPLKYIDKSIYFKLNEDGSYKSQCCGNLLDTDNVKVREYILSSLKHWMINYHIDGFRFDQCYLLSAETATLIENELKAINPNVYLYGEAWNERESEFSKLGWGSFNAYFRDVMRGDLHDTNIKGFLFGEYRPGENIDDIKSLLSGTTSGKTKTYSLSEHAVNFLEVHDDYCFNDYIRFSLGLNKKYDIINDPIKHIKLNDTQLKINKLGAMFLLLSKGVPIIHQGQEWGHSQIIASTSVNDINVGKMDRNPYNKDNSTNWVNWSELPVNIELVNFYKNLIELRKQFLSLSSLNTDNLFFDVIDERVIGYFPDSDLAVFFNGHFDETKEVVLPPGNWKILLDENDFNLVGFKTVDSKIVLPKLSGVFLQREK